MNKIKIHIHQKFVKISKVKIEISNTNNIISNQLKLTLFICPKAVENFPLDKRGQYSLSYSGKIYKFRDNILAYSEYLSNYFGNNINFSKDLALKFKYAISLQALDIVMRLLFGFEDVVIPNEEYIQVLAFMEELRN